MGFDTWNVRTLYWAGLLTPAAGELARYELEFVGVQEVRGDKGDAVKARNSNFFYGKGNENYKLRTKFFVQNIVVSVVKRVEGWHIWF
jgi:hypothetical protein